jgi:hypothetical protein
MYEKVAKEIKNDLNTDEESMVLKIESFRLEILENNKELDPLLKIIYMEKWGSLDKDLRKAKSLLNLIIEKLEYIILFFGISNSNNPSTVKLLTARLAAMQGVNLVNTYIEKKRSFEK